MHTEKAPDSIFFVLLIMYMVPQALQTFHNNHRTHFMYHNKHRRHFILCSKAQMQINSSIVVRQPEVVHTSLCNSPYKFKCKDSIFVSANQVQVQVQVQVHLTGPTAAVGAAAAAAAATSAGATT